MVATPAGVGALPYPPPVLDWSRVPLARRNPERVARLFRELSRFGMVGVVCLSVDVGLFNLLRFGLDVGPLTSKVLSTVVAASLSYLLNRVWSFGHTARTGVRREYVLFFVLNGIGLLISLTCLWVSHYLLGFTSPLADNVSANGVGLVLGTTFRFLSYKRWVFVSHDRAAALALSTVESAGTPSELDAHRGGDRDARVA